MFYQIEVSFFDTYDTSGTLAKSLAKSGKLQVKLESHQVLASVLSEILKASKMIRIYQKEDKENSKAGKVIDDLVKKNIKIGSIMIRATPIMETLTGFMIAGFIVFSGKLIASGEIGVNNFFSFLAAMMLAYQPIRSLATLNMTAYQGAAAFKRISTVIDKKIHVVNNENLPELTINKSEIEFKKVNFNYENTSEKAVIDLNLKIVGNTLNAFVGHSGAGKSTILIFAKILRSSRGINYDR